MSDDIVNRLREHAFYNWAEAMELAADEIVRLRSMVDDAKVAVAAFADRVPAMDDEIENLRAEVVTLRNAAVNADERSDRLRAEVDELFAESERRQNAIDHLRAEVAALQDQRREMHADTSDLAMLVRRLALALRKAQPEHSTVSDAAMEFLRKRGLDGEVLR